MAALDRGAPRRRAGSGCLRRHPGPCRDASRGPVPRHCGSPWTLSALGMLRLVGQGACRERPSVVADAVELPAAGGTFDGAMVAFGIATDGSRPGSKLSTVLKPGARLVVLDFTTPRLPLQVRQNLSIFRRVLRGLLGRLVSGHPTAYTNCLRVGVGGVSAPQIELRGTMSRTDHDCGYRLSDGRHQPRLTGGEAAWTACATSSSHRRGPSSWYGFGAGPSRRR